MDDHSVVTPHALGLVIRNVRGRISVPLSRRSALGDSIVSANIGMYSTRIPLMFYTQRGPHGGAYDPHVAGFGLRPPVSRVKSGPVRTYMHVHVHVVCV